MLQKFKKGLSLLLLSAKALALVLILVYIGLLSDDVRIMSTMGSTDVSYVLVNEDLGGVLNGIEFNLGTEFVTMITQDTQNRWQTASRSVAEAGFRSGSFDVMIILPQNFSERLLALQSFTPEQAEIVYEIRHGQNELVNMSIDAQVTEILNDFNDRIVRMYFASVLGNLFDAQLEFGAMVDGESQRRGFFVDHVQDLFLRLPSEFSSVVFQSESLQGLTEGWRLGHDQFTETTQDTLMSTVELLNNNSEMLTEYIALMSEMGQVNVSNTLLAMEQQSIADEIHYRSYFTSLNKVASDHMMEFHDGDYKVGTSLMSDFLREGADFEERQAWLETALRDQIDSLNDELTEMEGLRNLIMDIFFAGSATPPASGIDADGDIDAYIWQAIYDLISPNPATPDEQRLAEVYINTIFSDLSGLAVDEIEVMIDHLRNEMGLISLDDYNKYMDQLAIIRRFAAEEPDFVGGGSADFTTSQGRVFPIDARYNHIMSFPIMSNEWNHIRLGSSSNIVISNAVAVANNLQAELQSLSGPNGLDVSVIPWGEIPGKYTGFNVNFSVPLSCVPDLSATPPMNCERSDFDFPDTIDIPNDIILTWTFSTVEQGNIFNRSYLDWRITTPDDPDPRLLVTFELSHFFLSQDRDEGIIENLSLLLYQIGRVERASRQIITLFGDPTDQTIDGFWSEFDMGNWSYPSTVSIRELASPDSIYNRYGHFTDQERIAFVVEALHNNFHRRGIELYDELDLIRAALNSIINDGVPGEYYSLSQIAMGFEPNALLTEANALLNWHRNSVTELAGEYGTWTQGEILQLLMRENFGTPLFSENYIYYNTQSGENMIQLMSLLVAASQSEINNIISGSSELVNLDDDFDTLMGNTNNVYGQMDTILGNVAVLDDELYTNVNSNLAYAQNFSTIMENARIGGTENPAFLNFLPRPVTQVGTQVIAGEVSIIPYYLTVISTILNFSAGYGLRYFWKKRERTTVDQLVKRGLIWKNTPFVLKLTAVALAIGLIFSAISVRSVDTVQALAWLTFVPLLIIFGILIVTYLARQFPKASLFVVGIVIAIYLLLNPVLGTQIEPGTTMDWLFRVSPLQHVENIFTRLVAGEFFSIINYVMMVGLVMLGVVLNLLVTEKNIEMIEDVKNEK